MRDAIEREIRELHEFFVAWFGGALPKDESAWAAAPAVMADDFELVTPGGERIAREALLSQLYEGHGSRHMRIWIEQLQVRELGGGLHLATYHECQARDGRETRRQSSAVMREQPTARHGVIWVHVHETWIA
ncbi:MAG: DUF4440 domain-containing protein [Planctomycetota bacterium]